MKRFTILMLMLMLVMVGITQAQDSTTELADPVFTIAIQNFDGGEFVATDEADIFTLFLEEPVDITDFLTVAPSLLVLDFQTELFNTALESTVDLEAFEAVLILEDQKMTLSLSEFVRVDLETVQFTATFLDDVAELELEFDEAELVIYLNAANTELLNVSLENVGAGVRCFPFC